MKNKSILISTLATIALTICSNSSGASELFLEYRTPHHRSATSPFEWSNKEELLELFNVEVLENGKRVEIVHITKPEDCKTFFEVVDENKALAEQTKKLLVNHDEAIIIPHTIYKCSNLEWLCLTTSDVVKMHPMIVMLNKLKSLWISASNRQIFPSTFRHKLCSAHSTLSTEFNFETAHFSMSDDGEVSAQVNFNNGPGEVKCKAEIHGIPEDIDEFITKNALAHLPTTLVEFMIRRFHSNNELPNKAFESGIPTTLHQSIQRGCSAKRKRDSAKTVTEINKKQLVKEMWNLAHDRVFDRRVKIRNGEIVQAPAE
ncbi:hypothetical protein HOD08_02900 [bacterium]|jgi:hypothetical protein|nr:hypothetical protein [bacterium]